MIKSPSIGRMLLVLMVFCLAGGLDFIGYFVLRAQPLDLHNLVNLEAWTFLQYSSNTTLIYWVPQHAIPAWLITGLVINCIDGHEADVKYLGIGLAGCLISSPFGTMGLLPYLLVFLVIIWKKGDWQFLFSKQSLFFNMLALPISMMVILYLSSNKFSFPSGFLWEFSDNPLIYIGWFEFCMMEFGILSVFVFAGIWLDRTTYFRKLSPLNNFENYLKERHGLKSEQYTLFVVSVIVLLLLPSYKMGYSNDFVMRGSIPTLFIFWSCISKIFVDSGFPRNIELRFPYIVIMCVLIVGFYNSLAQISESIHKYHFGPPDKNIILIVGTANHPRVVEQRIGNDDTFFYRYFGK